MTQQVLILGGSGRIGSKVAADLIAHTSVDITIAGRNSTTGAEISRQLGERVIFQAIDLAAESDLKAAISRANLVIHCAGPFHYRDASVLRSCIAQGVNYIDVSDHPSFTRKSIGLSIRS